VAGQRIGTVTGKPLDAVGFDLAERPVGKHYFHADDGVKVADWRNYTFGRQDDLTGFVKWVKANPDLDEPVKKMIAGLAAEFHRERGKGR
jgi:hypothetical protein